jgi:hypothetical protein
MKTLKYLLTITNLQWNLEKSMLLPCPQTAMSLAVYSCYFCWDNRTMTTP